MLAINVPNDVQKVLDEITGNFEVNYKQDFIDEGQRIKRKNIRHKLDNVFINKGNINIDLSNLKLKTPVFAVKKLQINLAMLNVYIEADLGQLLIDSDFKQTAVDALIPMTKSGKITFVLDGVTFCGNIGLYIVEDSFMANTFDLDIKCSKILNKVKCNDSPAESFERPDNLENPLVKNIWPQLIYAFEADILYSLVSAKICEYSVSELLLDEPDQMREISSARETTVNNFIDSLLNAMNEYFAVITRQTTLETPALVISVPNKDGQNGILKCDHGEVEDLAFKRAIDMSVYEDEGVQYIHGKIRVKDFKFKYVSCSAEYGNQTSDKGTIKVSAYRNEIFLKLSIRKKDNAVYIYVDKVRVLKLLDIDCDVLNLDCLNSEHDQLNTYILSSVYGMVFPVLEKKIEEGLLYAIANRRM